MINAAEAYNKSMESEAALHENEIRTIESAILLACSKGHTSINIDGKLSNYVVNMLKDLGYKVTFTDNQRDGTLTDITWWNGGDI